MVFGVTRLFEDAEYLSWVGDEWEWECSEVASAACDDAAYDVLVFCFTFASAFVSLFLLYAPVFLILTSVFLGMI